MITGVSGGEYAIRGRLTAFDASTGREKLAVLHDPRPEQTGHDTWPRAAPLAQRRRPGLAHPSATRSSACCTSRPATPTPTTTAAARGQEPLRGVDRRARRRPASCAGITRWSTTTSGLRRAEPDRPLRRDVDGKSVRDRRGREDGLALPADRETGEPLFPTPETPVPQNAKQKTWPTQPIPSYEPSSPGAHRDQYTAVVRRWRRPSSA